MIVRVLVVSCGVFLKFQIPNLGDCYKFWATFADTDNC